MPVVPFEVESFDANTGKKVMVEIPVDFPFPPYESQKAYMHILLKALIREENALLESPTGTGKTLCLLCASLAFQKFKRERGESPPSIIYSSRTHSQLAQVMKELKGTSYQPTFGFMGSRDQLCLNRKVQQLPSYAKSHMCNQLGMSCHFKLGLPETFDDALQRRFRDLHIGDMEDIVTYGRDAKQCPYFLSRTMTSRVMKSDGTIGTADIVFVPYNYIIDEDVQKRAGLDIENKILIFDEAHNVESVCQESAGCEVMMGRIISACSNVHELLKNMSNPNQAGGSDRSKPNVTQCQVAIMILNAIVEKLEAYKLGPDKKSILGFEWLFNLLGEACEDKKDTIATYNENLIPVLDYVVSSAMSAVDDGAGNAEIVKQQTVGCQEVMAFLKAVFNAAAYEDDFKVLFREEAPKSTGRVRSFDQTTSKERVLSLWCFSPGHTMCTLSAKARNVILTSGTLSPLEGLEVELRAHFPNKLENSHVIEPDQVWAGVVKTGPSGARLNSSYANRDNVNYLPDLGNAIVNFSRMVPDGLLVFFPSYFALNSSLENWREGGTNSAFDRISKNKVIFEEPKNAKDIPVAMEAFQRTIMTEGKGAILFAVCRGKISEGIDFADRCGRGVVVTGIPFPMKTDPKVEMKRQYMDDVLKRSPELSIGGAAWYVQQASRAVNQAVGRVIRHKNDYGAVLFCDERFASAQNIAGMSKWLRPRVEVFDKFGRAIFSLSKFFKKWGGEIVLKYEREVKKKEEPVFQITSRSKREESTPAPMAQGPSIAEIHATRNPMTIAWVEMYEKRAEEERMAELEARKPLSVTEILSNKEGTRVVDYRLKATKSSEQPKESFSQRAKREREEALRANPQDQKKTKQDESVARQAFSSVAQGDARRRLQESCKGKITKEEWILLKEEIRKMVEGTVKVNPATNQTPNQDAKVAAVKRFVENTSTLLLRKDLAGTKKVILDLVGNPNLRSVLNREFTMARLKQGHSNRKNDDGSLPI